MRFCPILRIDGSSSSGFSRASASPSGTCCRSPSPKSKAAAGAVAERHVAGPAGRDRQREADEIGLHGDRGWWSRCRRRSGRRRGPRRSRPRAAAARSPSRTGTGRSWPWRRSSPARPRPAAWRRRRRAAAWRRASQRRRSCAAPRRGCTVEPTDRSTGGGASAPSPSAMRLVSVLNSISRRKPSSAVGLGVAHAQLLDRHGRRARPA